MSESIKIDLRLDPGLKEILEAIAVKYFDARTHHKSGRPEITATINRLIKLGIKALEDGHPDTSVSYPDGMELVVTQKVNEAIAAALAPITEEMETLKKIIEKLSTAAPPSLSEPVKIENLPLLEALQKPEPSEPMELMEGMESLETVETAIAPAPSEPNPDFSQGLYGKDLAARLGRARSSVSDNSKNPDHFREWSQKLDPDGLTWEKRNDDRFYPVG